MTRYIIVGALGSAVLTVVGLALRDTALNLWDSWRNARAVIRQTQDEYAPGGPVRYWPDVDVLGAHAAVVLAITCDWCREGGSGRCVCLIRCTDAMCQGRSTLATWTEGDFEWAAAQGFSLGERSELQ